MHGASSVLKGTKLYPELEGHLKRVLGREIIFPFLELVN